MMTHALALSRLDEGEEEKVRESRERAGVLAALRRPATLSDGRPHHPVFLILLDL
jgi:hypothetical protein